MEGGNRAYWTQYRLGDCLGLLYIPAEEIVIVSDRDRFISNAGAYKAAVRRAIELAGPGRLIFSDIKPKYPETSFGCVPTNSEDQENVVSSHEKPVLKQPGLL